MATITGQKLTDLTTITAGAMSSGFMFYTVSPGSASYKIYERDLFNAMSALHISGAFQPRGEDWRFVHKTGDESITGSKTFINDALFNGYVAVVDSIGTAYLEDLNINGMNVYLNNGTIKDSNILSLLIDCLNRKLYAAGSNISLDWQNRVLSGNWNIGGGILTISGQSVATGSVSTTEAFTFNTPLVNFKNTGKYDIYTVPASRTLCIDRMEIVTRDMDTPGTAPYIKFGNSTDYGAYQPTIQTTSNTALSRHIFDNPQDAIASTTIINGTIVTASTALVHSGYFVVRGYII